MSNRVQAALNQARKLQSELEEFHDLLNEKYGAGHEYTQKMMRYYCFAFGMMCDLEAALDDGDGE